MKKFVLQRVCLIFLLVFPGFSLSACGPAEIAHGKELATQTAEPESPNISTMNMLKHVSPTLAFTRIPATQAPENLITPLATTDKSVKIFIATETQTIIPEFLKCSPLDNFPLEKLPKIVSDPYNPPPMGSDDRHQGVDFVYHRLAGVDIPILGVQVNSVLPGTVSASLSDTFPYGNLVIIETPGNWLPEHWLATLDMTVNQSLYLLYAHLQEKPLVDLGDTIESCQAIGKVGNSGNTEAAHLHLETRIGPGGMKFQSMYGLLREAPEDARKNYKLWRTSGVFQHFDPMLLLLQIQ